MGNAINDLLDKAKQVCLTDAATASRLGVVPQHVSRWRRGHDPISEERIVQIAKIARENEGFWLARIAAEQAHGETRRAWERVVKTLSAAAAVALLVAPIFAQNASANSRPGHAEQGHALDIMRNQGWRL